MITVKFQKQSKKVKADDNGDWSVRLDELTATNNPQQLIIQGKRDKILLKNILIGEVWLVSGQSNMEYSMHNHPQYAKPQKGDPDYLYKEYITAKSPVIRTFYVEKNLKADTLPSDGWQMLNEKTLAPVSAIGYFFAKSLVENLDIPVGIISTSWGGTPIETWTPEQAYLNSPMLKNHVTGHKLNNIIIGERFDKMVAPMIPYSLKGFLWYQGETNVINGDGEIYAEKQKCLIESWRSAWEDERLSFYYVQLAPYTYSQRRGDLIASTWEALPSFWEVQTSCLNIPYTGMVVTTDLVDDPKDIHPSYKWIVGERLARLALCKDYGRSDLICSGPTFKKMTVDKDKITLEFDHIGSGLVTNDGKDPDWFYLKGDNGRFKKVHAVIHENKIILSGEYNMKNPVIRFGWDEVAMPNLFNKEGLPAVPFRTKTMDMD
ncbi:MAG: sialate O-acetylesterase [Tannerella sp.]|jgi:sialate O-acetylesterase|nr:sialate O-acetylesterase [Tannerella sp.]